MSTPQPYLTYVRVQQPGAEDDVWETEGEHDRLGVSEQGGTLTVARYQFTQPHGTWSPTDRTTYPAGSQVVERRE